MKVADWPVFIWLTRLSSHHDLGDAAGRQAAHEAGPADIRLVDLETQARGQQNTKRCDDAQEAALAVGGFQHNNDERDVGAVLGHDVLHESALLGRGPRRSLTAHLPLAVGVLDHALSAGPAGPEQGREPQAMPLHRTEPTASRPSVSPSSNPLPGQRPPPLRFIFGPLGPWQGRDVKREGRFEGMKCFWRL